MSVFWYSQSRILLSVYEATGAFKKSAGHASDGEQTENEHLHISFHQRLRVFSWGGLVALSGIANKSPCPLASFEENRDKK